MADTTRAKFVDFVRESLQIEGIYPVLCISRHQGSDAIYCRFLHHEGG